MQNGLRLQLGKKLLAIDLACAPDICFNGNIGDPRRPLVGEEGDASAVYSPPPVVTVKLYPFIVSPKRESKVAAPINCGIVPKFPPVALYKTCAAVRVFSEATAAVSFVAFIEVKIFGIAIIAMIRMIVTTIRSSKREKPFADLLIMK